MELVTQHFIMSKDLNAFGNVFGGTVLAWLDEAGAVYVMQKINYKNIVTVSMDNVNFRNPAKMGDILQIFAETIRTGKSSIRVRVEAIARDNNQPDRVIIDCEITYVCLKDGKPYPHFTT